MKKRVQLRWLSVLLALLGPVVGVGGYLLDQPSEYSSVLAYLPFTGHDRAVTLGIEVFLGYEMVVGLLVLTQAWNREKNLRRHNELMGSVIQSVSEGVVVAATDGSFLVVNEAARRITGDRRGPGLQAVDWSGSYGLYQPESGRLFPTAELPLVRALRGEHVGETDVLVHNPQAPGTADVWVSVTAAPILDRRGELLGGVTVFRDITEKKHAEELTQRLSNAVEQTADSVFITDRAGRIEYVNPAFETTTGYPRAEAVGATPRLLKSGRQEPEFYRTLWESISTGTTFKATVINRKKGGELFIAEQTITPMRDSRNGELTHFVAVMRDLTDRLKFEGQGLELRLAASMQQRLFPTTPPRIPGWDIAGAFSPALATCGDYFDFIELPDHRLVLAVADVCGHGMGPALITAATRGYVRSLARTGVPLGELVAGVNRLLLDDLDERHFVTMLLASLETQTGKLEWANMGHPAGYLLDASGEVRVVLESTSKPLGLFAEAGCTLGEPCVIAAGETLVLVTDGAIEAESPAGQVNGADGVLRTIRTGLDTTARELVESVIGATRAHAAGAPQADDITVVVVKRG
ncbi:MAG TPA: SpoIIE family protein phosphatase [Thermoanaerobaculaceae bacterium]|nr:SpoIIE family protein phosphatase [Thermoanaerobaculaceae bacterium]